MTIPLVLAVKMGSLVLAAGGTLAVGTAIADGNSTPAHTVANTSKIITIRHGDTLGGLALRYCGTASAYPSLALANHLADPNHIISGRHLTIVCTGAPPARFSNRVRSIQPRPVATVTVTVTATAPAAAVTVTATPTPSPKQAIVPASTPRPTQRPTQPPTATPTARPTPAPTHSARVAPAGSKPPVITSGRMGAPGQVNIPGTSITQYSAFGAEQLWLQAHGSRAAQSVAYCIAIKGSNGNVLATGSGGRVGLWQIPQSSGLATYDVMGNAMAAVKLSHNGTNWSAWPWHAACGV
jgi:nucleoid-associated protein YgaU